MIQKNMVQDAASTEDQPKRCATLYKTTVPNNFAPSHPQELHPAVLAIIPRAFLDNGRNTLIDHILGICVKSSNLVSMLKTSYI